MSTTLAVLRFPLTPAQGKGRDVVTTPEGTAVMSLDAEHRGRQVDVSAPDGRPLGRMLDVGRRQWQLVAPGSGAVLAHGDLRHGVYVRIGTGPEATVKGRGEEWDLLWEHTVLLAARKVPRKVAKHRLDVWVEDPACTPAVVAFVVHLRRWWAADEATTQMIINQTLTAAPPPSATY